MPLAVLNPKGRDPEQAFPDGPGEPGAGPHPPTNFHAYAACTRGSFHADTRRALATGNPVLVLARRRLERTRAAVEACRAAGRTTLVSWKETGLAQVEARLASESTWRAFREIVARADGALSATEELLPVYRAACPDTPAVFLPTPYPVDFPGWDFSRPLEECSGLFVGTRGFGKNERGHVLALSLAALLSRETGCRVTVVNPDGRAGEKRIRAAGVPDERLEVTPPLPYADYLRVLASHRLVLQRDLGGVPGQVAGDALLARVPCVGGSGAVDRIAFPGWCAGEAGGERLLAIARQLLMDDDEWRGQRAVVEERSLEKLSYRVIAPRLEAFASDPASAAP